MLWTVPRAFNRSVDPPRLRRGVVIGSVRLGDGGPQVSRPRFRGTSARAGCRGWRRALTLVALSVGLFSAGWRGPAVAVSVADDAVVRWLSGISGPGYLGVMRALAALSSFWLMTATLWALVVALLLFGGSGI